MSHHDHVGECGHARVVGHLGGGDVVDLYVRARHLLGDTIGGPATVGILEEVWVKGAEKVLLFGTCGGLDADLPAGHLICRRYTKTGRPLSPGTARRP